MTAVEEAATRDGGLKLESWKVVMFSKFVGKVENNTTF
jgi:hypothetical protein